MKEKMEECYRRLQTLDIKPTKNNMETLLQCLYDMKDIYDELERMETDERAETDPEGRNDD